MRFISAMTSRPKGGEAVGDGWHLAAVYPGGFAIVIGELDGAHAQAVVHAQHGEIVVDGAAGEVQDAGDLALGGDALDVGGAEGQLDDVIVVFDHAVQRIDVAQRRA